MFDVRSSPNTDFINVRADAAVKLKIGTTDEMIARAAENFLNWNTTDISNSVKRCLGRKPAGSDRSDGAP